MGNICTTRRYLKGKKPLKYFNEDLWPEMREVFEILHVSKPEAYQIFRGFMKVDRNHNGSVNAKEFHTFFKIKPTTKFSERVFLILDANETGELEFKDFFVGVWNYCTYDDNHLIKFCFDLFDVDEQGQLDVHEYDAMLRMLYNTKQADPTLLGFLKEHDKDGSGDINLEEFRSIVKEHPQMLFPAFRIQENVRKAMLGHNYWLKMSARRHEIFAHMGVEGMSSTNGITAVLTVKARERAEENRLREEAEEAERVKKAAEEAALEKERAENEDVQEEAEMLAGGGFTGMHGFASSRPKGPQTKDEKKEVRAWEAFINAKKRRNDMAESQDFDAVRKARMRVWALLKSYLDTRERNWRLRERAAAEHAATVAAERFEIYKRTREGKLRVKYDAKRKLAAEKGMPPGRAWAFSGRRAKIAVIEHTHAFVVEEILQDHLEELELEFREQDRLRAEDGRVKEEAITEEFGTYRQTWDEVWDAANRRAVWLNFKNGRTQLTRPHVCEGCHHKIEDMDLKCFYCDSNRSALNRRLYEAMQPHDASKVHYHEFEQVDYTGSKWELEAKDPNFGLMA